MKTLYPVTYHHFTSNEIKPAGWLLRQLRIQAEGLSGHLDKIWPDVSQSAWIGGDKEGWERVPYWLDGFVPLAWLLDDADLKARAQRYIDAILAGQKADGWICPCADDERAHYDMWAAFLICKALMVYGECSGDTRAWDAVYRALRQLKDRMRFHTLFGWGQSRWFECLIPLAWLYEKQPEDWMLDLALRLRTQGLDYETLFAYWRDQEPRAEWAQQTHIVNLMMALKAEAVFSGVSGKDPNEFARNMFAQLTAAHGSAVGHIEGDECLAGTSPIHGTELCAIAEAMYSCEILSEITGNPEWMDLCETLAFNSLPATISADMWTHQYLQLENQIACTAQEQPVVYYTNNAESNRFGLEPNYGCCTANFNQAWPKLALSTFLHADGEILSAILAPSQVETVIGGARVRIALETDYPFKSALRYTVVCEEPVEFTLAVRIPGFAKAAVLDGESVAPGKIARIRRVWSGETTVDLTLALETEWIARPDDLYALRRGPLFYSLPIQSEKTVLEYERDGVERKFPYCDYDELPTGEWRYGFAGEDFTVIEHEIGEYPFSREHAPIQLKARMARVAWDTLEGQPNVCAPTPRNREALSEEDLLLQPYGCTTLRMTVMPRAVHASNTRKA